MATPAQPTHTIISNSRIAPQMSRAKQNEANNALGVILDAGDEVPEPKYKLYVYNLLDLEHVVEQPPVFPHFVIPPCERGQKFSVTTLPAFVKERYEKPGTTEFNFKKVDGRKYATSLLNPSAFPGTVWEAQLSDWKSNDQFGNNLNALGVFWSMHSPEDQELEKELEIFRIRARQTMNALIKKGELLNAQGKQDEITPLQHFAMDYLKKQASWHMQSDHLVDCPTCGEPVKEGIVYHKNSWGDKCPVDYAKCRELGIIPNIQAGDAKLAAEEVVPQANAEELGMTAEELEMEMMANAGAKREVETKRGKGKTGRK